MALLCATTVVAQPSLLDMVFDDDDAQPVWEAVEHFREQPLCLYAATAADLTMVPGLSLHVATRILRVAQIRPSWDVSRIADSLCLALPQRLMMMLCITTRCDTTQWSTAASFRISSDDDIGSRLALQYGAWRIDMLATRIGRNEVGIGHVGATVRASIGSTDVLLGDVRPRIGTGLIMGSAGMSYGGMTVTADEPFTLRPWTSQQRRGFLRGGAAGRRDTLGAYVLHTMAAAATRRLDTRLDTAEHVASINDAASTLSAPPAGRIAVSESIVGTAIAMSDSVWHVGLTAWSFQYDRPLNTTAADDIIGVGGPAWSCYGGYQRDSGCLTWEAAQDTRGRTAVVALGTFVVNASRFTASLRWLAAGYRAPYGNAPTASAAASNEAGLTLSALLRPSTDTRLHLVADIRRSLDRTYFVPRPVRGVAADVVAQQRLTRHGTISLRARIDNVDDNVRIEGVARIRTALRTRLRMTAGIDWRISSPLTVSCRWNAHHARWSAYEHPITGHALTVRFRYRPWPWLHVLMQQSMFDTPGINVAAYVAEAPMPGLLRTPVLVGVGTRSLLGIRARLLPTMSVWAAAVDSDRERRLDVMLQWNLDGTDASATDQEFVGGNLTDEGLGDGQ